MQTDRPTPELSPREQQLLKYAAEGLTDTAIANKLGISEATVGTYWGRVRIKLGPFSRTELVAIMLRAERDAAVEQLRRENQQLIKELESQASPSGSSVYHDLIENAPDAIVLVSETGIIEHVNITAREIFGYSTAELSGHHLHLLIPERYRGVHTQHREDYVKNPQRRQMGDHHETPALHKDGREFPVRAALSAIETPAGMLIMCVLRPLE